MYFLWDSEGELALDQFGIEIPFQKQALEKIVTFVAESSFQNDDLANLPAFSEAHCSRGDMARVHHESYLSQYFGSEKQKTDVAHSTFELYNSDGDSNRFSPSNQKHSFSVLLERARRQSAGLCYAVEQITRFPEVYFLGGGYHHAMSFGGRGFCLLNDIIIALRRAQHHKLISTAWVIDVDAHKGDGTAELTINDQHIATLSIHMKAGWPLDHGNKDEDPWHIPSTLDIPIGTGEEDRYLGSLKKGLEKLWSLHPNPDVALVVQGADPYEKDSLLSASLLNLNLDQMHQRDLLVYDFFHARNIPQVYCMSGGYGPWAWEPYLQFFKSLEERNSLCTLST